MKYTGTHKKQTGGIKTALSVFIAFFLLFAAQDLVAVSYAGSNHVDDQNKADSSQNIARWKNMSEVQKDHFRKLYKRYRSMPVEKQARLNKKMNTFNKLPNTVKRLILNSYERLLILSDDDRKSFFKLIKKYQNLPPKKKAVIHRAFRKIKTLPKTKQLELFYHLIEESKKPTPAIRKVIKDFLIQTGLFRQMDHRVKVGD